MGLRMQREAVWGWDQGLHLGLGLQVQSWGIESFHGLSGLESHQPLLEALNRLQHSQVPLGLGVSPSTLQLACSVRCALGQRPSGVGTGLA